MMTKTVTGVASVLLTKLSAWLLKYYFNRTTAIICVNYAVPAEITARAVALQYLEPKTSNLWQRCQHSNFQLQLHAHIAKYRMVYPRRWSVSGRTNNDLADRSQALHRLAARSLATASSPGGNGAFFCMSTTQILVPRPDRLLLSNNIIKNIIIQCKVAVNQLN